MKAKHIMHETFRIQPDCRVILSEQVEYHTPDQRRLNVIRAINPNLLQCYVQS